jgi:hypothetical protein
MFERIQHALKDLIKWQANQAIEFFVGHSVNRSGNTRRSHSTREIAVLTTMACGRCARARATVTPRQWRPARAARAASLSRPCKRRGKSAGARRSDRRFRRCWPRREHKRRAVLPARDSPGIVLRIAGKPLICGGGVGGRFTAKLLKVCNFAWSCEPHQQAERMAAPTKPVT